MATQTVFQMLPRCDTTLLPSLVTNQKLNACATGMTTIGRLFAITFDWSRTAMTTTQHKEKEKHNIVLPRFCALCKVFQPLTKANFQPFWRLGVRVVMASWWHRTRPFPNSTRLTFLIFHPCLLDGTCISISISMKLFPPVSNRDVDQSVLLLNGEHPQLECSIPKGDVDGTCGKQCDRPLLLCTPIVMLRLIGSMLQTMMRVSFQKI